MVRAECVNCPGHGHGARDGCKRAVYNAVHQLERGEPEPVAKDGCKRVAGPGHCKRVAYDAVHQLERGEPEPHAPIGGRTGSAGERQRLARAVYFALFMFAAEIVGGVLANSLAILTDAAHMLSDVGGFVVSLVCLNLASKGATSNYTFGFKQAEVLGALLSVALVWMLTVGLLLEAMRRFYNLPEINAHYMLGTSVLGLVVNLLLMWVLGHGYSHGGHSHGHGHSHGGCGHGDDGHHGSLAMRAAITHVVGDIVQSLGVCTAAVCIGLRPFDVGVTETGVSKWNYADPLSTVLFGILVLLTTRSTLAEAITSLMGKAPNFIDQSLFMERLTACPFVSSIHDLHVWVLGTQDVLCTAHLVVDGSEHCTAALQAAIQVAQSMGIGQSTFQIEIKGEFDAALESQGLHGNRHFGYAESPTLHTGQGDVCGGHGHSHGPALISGPNTLEEEQAASAPPKASGGFGADDLHLSCECTSSWVMQFSFCPPCKPQLTLLI